MKLPRRPAAERAPLRRTAAYRVLAVAAAGAAAVALAACSESASPAGGGGGGAGGPVDGGALTVGINQPLICVDPQQTSTTAPLNALDTAFETLTDQDPKTGKLVPWLATSWSANSTSTQYTFHLRTGVTFSNGQPFNAAAVAANLNAIQKLGALSPRATTLLAGYAGSTVINASTVRVNFSSPNAVFLLGTANPSMAMLAPASLSQSPADLCAGTGLYGSGPFTISHYTPSQTLVVTRRNDYNWGSALNEHKGKAYLQKITFNGKHSGPPLPSRARAGAHWTPCASVSSVTSGAAGC